MEEYVHGSSSDYGPMSTDLCSDQGDVICIGSHTQPDKDWGDWLAPDIIQNPFPHNSVSVGSRASGTYAQLQALTPTSHRSSVADSGSPPEDWQSIEEEANEEGFPIPNREAISNAKKILASLQQYSDRQFDTYPTPEGEVAIDSPDGTGQSFLVLCESSGEVLYVANLESGPTHLRCPSGLTVPEEFIANSINALK